MYAILSDIHGNMYAFQMVLEDMKKFDIQGVILLGDLIDYGMQSNEVVQYIQDKFEYEITCNIWGNHEQAIMQQNYTRFSSQRGIDCAKYTASILTDKTKTYLNQRPIREGKQEFIMQNLRCLAVHGSLDDCYWKAILPDNVRGDYENFDLVFSGHSHNSHFFTKFYKINDPAMRNKHAVYFINPGSVGQPRNLNPYAQYALFEPENKNVMLRAVPYGIKKAMSLYDGEVDSFYKDRLIMGV